MDDPMNTAAALAELQAMPTGGPVQQALLHLFQQGLITIAGTRDGQIVWESTEHTYPLNTDV